MSTLRFKGSETAQMAVVWSVIGMLIAVGFGALIFGKVYSISETQAEDTGDTVTLATLNSDISENTLGVPDYWDNFSNNDNRTFGIDNAGNHFLRDNGDNGICYWRQSLNIGTYGRFVTGTVNAKFQLSDNSGVQAHEIQVIIGTSTENYIVYENLTKIAADNSAWHTVDNDVTAWIDARGAGTYYLYLFDNAVQTTSELTDNIVVRWDDASLSVDVYNYSLTENIVADTGATAVDVFPLILLMVIVGVIVALIAILKGMM